MFEWFVRKNIAKSSFIERGWGNGYAKIPKDHWLYGLDYNEVSESINVHYGLTYGSREGEFWVFGFDTGHHKDDLEKWTKSEVEREAQSLARQLWRLEQPTENNCQINSFDNCEVCENNREGCFCT